MSKALWIEQNLKAGEHYAGILLGKDGAPDHHLILLSGDNEKRTTWAAAGKEAKAIGGELPTRREQSLLFANLKEQFVPGYFWSCEQHASYPSDAWYQDFGNGYQSIIHKSYEGRARAVRRVAI